MMSGEKAIFLSFIRGGSATPAPFAYLFLRKRYPSRIPFIEEKGPSFTYLLRKLHPFSKSLKWSQWAMLQENIKYNQEPVFRKPRKLFGPVKRFLDHLYLKTEKCIHLKLLVWREPLFLTWLRIREQNNFVTVRLETLLWLSEHETFPRLSRNRPQKTKQVLLAPKLARGQALS